MSLNFFHSARMVRQLAALTPANFQRFASLAHGSRTPVSSAPPWVTLEVLDGGFASGRFAAQLSDNDTKSSEMLASCDRMRELTTMLHQGNYTLREPEQGALLVVAALINECADATSAEAAAANEAELQRLVAEIGPFLDQLRLHPYPVEGGEGATSSTNNSGSGLLYIQPMIDTIQQLKYMVAQPDQIPRFIRQQQNAVAVLAVPLKLRALALVEQSYITDIDSEKSFPFQRGMGDDWWQEAAAIVGAFDQMQQIHQNRMSKYQRTQSSLALIVNALRPCLAARSTRPHISARTVGLIAKRCREMRRRKYGTDAAARAQYERKAMSSAPASEPYIAAVVVTKRLENFIEKKGGMQAAAGPLQEDISLFLHRFSPEEVQDAVKCLKLAVSDSEALSRRRLSFDIANCRAVVCKLLRCQENTLSGLIETGTVKSTAQVGRVIEPLLAATLAKSNFSNLSPELRALAQKIVLAFRKRRSLLLLDLEKQVQITELPWYSALGRIQQQKPEQQHNANQFAGSNVGQELIREVFLTVLAHMPEQPLANELMSACNMISRNVVTHTDLGSGPAGAAAVAQRESGKNGAPPTPWMEELAADIFMNAFSSKFEIASKQAAAVLSGTLYEKYYGIDYCAILQGAPANQGNNNSRGTQQQNQKQQSMTPLLDAARNALIRSFEAKGTNANARNFILANRREIESAALVTSHNLAQFVFMLAGGEEGNINAARRIFTPDFVTHAAMRCLKKVLRLRLPAPDATIARRFHFLQVKNSAVSWRHMVFFLSMLEPSSAASAAVVGQLEDHARKEVARRCRGADLSALAPESRQFVQERLLPFFAFAKKFFAAGDDPSAVAAFDKLPVTSWFDPPVPILDDERRRDRGSYSMDD